MTLLPNLALQSSCLDVPRSASVACAATKYGLSASPSCAGFEFMDLASAERDIEASYLNKRRFDEALWKLYNQVPSLFTPPGRTRPRSSG